MNMNDYANWWQKSVELKHGFIYFFGTLILVSSLVGYFTYRLTNDYGNSQSMQMYNSDQQDLSNAQSDFDYAITTSNKLPDCSKLKDSWDATACNGLKIYYQDRLQ